MSAQAELYRMLQKAEVQPFRRVGKVLALYRAGTPAETVRAACAAVKLFAPTCADEWPDAPPGTDPDVSVADVCDDPCPRDVDPAECPVAWLVARCGRYHFRIVAAPPNGIAFEGTDGRKMATVTPYLPAWFVAACKERRPEIVAHVNAQVDLRPEPNVEAEMCPVCGADVSDPETRALLVHPLHCDRGGARAGVTDGNGRYHPPEPRCPYKGAA